jgi:hypothetical protein
MKKLIFIVIMMLGFDVNSQTMEKSYLNHLLDMEKVQETQLFSTPKKVLFRRNRIIVVFDRKNWVKMGKKGRRKFY